MDLDKLPKKAEPQSPHGEHNNNDTYIRDNSFLRVEVLRK